MIHVDRQPEPSDFGSKVRQPGRAWLAANPDAEPAEWPPHWRKCLGDLLDRYGRVCAYLCIRIPHGVGASSVDHLAPKSKHKDQAYEWGNYRLVCLRMNSRKSAFEDVLDPFEIDDGWFVLDLTALQVMPASHLPSELREQVQATIDRLRLNDKECRDARAMYYDEYVAGHCNRDFLRRWSPFVAMELDRQGL